VNLPGSVARELNGRPADFFLFSPLYTGSSVTGYRPTGEFEGGQLTLGDAMAISGAAVNPQLGYKTNRLLGFALTLFNARLGLWVENPRNVRRMGGQGISATFWQFCLFLELFSLADEKRLYVNVSDGGHVDNTGLYELLRRRCATIILSDASSDTEHGFDDLAGLIRRARIDLGIQIDIDCSPLIPDPATGLAGSHVAKGTIAYPDRGKGTQTGTLWLTKTTVTTNDPVDIKEYRIATGTFPNQSTIDQFFDEAQFESYRELGYRAGKELSKAMA
jgi:hypothetical protein